MAFNCQASHSPALPKRVSGWEQLSLENAWCEVMISEVQGADVIEFPFAESLPKSEDPAIMSEVREMQNAWDEHGGLVPKAALPQIFGVSQQAAYAYPKKYNLRQWTFFKKTWLSMNEVKALHGIRRPSGFKGHSTAAMIRDCLSDARKD